MNNGIHLISSLFANYICLMLLSSRGGWWFFLQDHSWIDWNCDQIPHQHLPLTD